MSFARPEVTRFDTEKDEALQNPFFVETDFTTVGPTKSNNYPGTLVIIVDSKLVCVRGGEQIVNPVDFYVTLARIVFRFCPLTHVFRVRSSITLVCITRKNVLV